MRTFRAAYRMTLFVLATLGLYGLWWLFHWVVPNKIYWRQWIFAAWTKSFVVISRMRLEVTGTPPKPPFFLVSNHLSYADIAAIRAAVDGVFVAKAEIQGWPLAGRICRDMGTIFIDRTNRRDIPRAGSQIIERLDQGEGVVVFPEGISTRGDQIYPFNSSFLEFAAKARIPVSYAALRFETPAGEMPAHQAVCWWEDIDFFPHLWRLLKVKSYTAQLHFGAEPVIGEDRKLLASELRDRVAERFKPVE